MSDLNTILGNLKKLAALPLEQATAMFSEMYTSAGLLELEKERIFNDQWLCAGRVDAIPNPGDYLTYFIGAQPIVIIRQVDGEILAFANVCRHRMMQLLFRQWYVSTQTHYLSLPCLDLLY